MITTRDSLGFQYSIIYGYSSYKEDLTAGNIIGPGKLARKKVKTLSNEVIKFLKMYNALLRDFSGSEVFAIEFSLYHPSEKESEIYPRSMILVPGKYKECESLLLALKPEIGYLNVHKSRKSLNNISELFFEIEEFSEHPDLDKRKQSLLLDKFAKRFSQKLYGKLLENKWNKKMIGLNEALPTDKEYLNKYASIKGDYDIQWKEQPHQLEMSNETFEKYNPINDEKLSMQHLKYMISEPSAEFITKNTLKLGADLMKLVNTGTIDETQDNMIRFLLNKIYNSLRETNKVIAAQSLIGQINHICNQLKVFTNKYLEYLNEFLKSGAKSTLDVIIKKLERHFEQKADINIDDFRGINQIFSKLCKENIVQKDKIRAIELNSLSNYFTQIIKNSYSIILTSLSRYLNFRHFIKLNNSFEKQIRKFFEKEKKPAKILANRIFSRLKERVRNDIELNLNSIEEYSEFNENIINTRFKEIYIENTAELENFELKIADIVSFAETMMDQNKRKFIENDIEKLKKFTKELNYLLSYILRYNTINLFIKELEKTDFVDPVMFANKFHRYLERRIGGIRLEWKDYILEWVKDYASKFIRMEEAPNWNLKELYDDFFKYLRNRITEEQDTQNFLKFLDYYIGKLKEGKKKKAFIDFLRNYEVCLDIKTEFPKYIKVKIRDLVNGFNFESETLEPIDYLIENENENFYDYITKNRLKYYSDLVPRPFSLILRHHLDNEEEKKFRDELYHVFNFKFFKNNLKIDISDNFQEAYKKWSRND